MEQISTIILAAGKGTRMAAGAPSPKPKVLYEIGEKPMILHTLEILKKSGLKYIIIVVGYKAGEIKKLVGSGFIYAYQKETYGTGHALKIALKYLSPDSNHVLVLNGDDSAFYTPHTLNNVLEKHVTEGNTITFVTLDVADPTGLGRIIRKNGKVLEIIEEKLATEEEKNIKEVNDGLYIFDRDWLEKNIGRLKKRPVGEYYLVDLISFAVEGGKKVDTYRLADRSQWQGVNTLEELEIANQLMQQKKDHAS